jgi:aspartate aminotransferase
MSRSTLPDSLSPNVAFLRESATIAVSQRAKALRAEGRDIIDLGAGEPDFETPEFIREAAQRALDEGATRYTAVEGMLPLREAIAAVARERWEGEGTITATDVVVSTGSKQSLFNACFTLFGAGDEVLIPAPSWTSYYEMVALARAVPVPVPGDPSRGLKIDVDRLARAAGDRTRGLMLNSPCNPTGAIYSRDELRDILALADARGWWVLSDEIYREITYGTDAPSALHAAPSLERLVTIDGVAKRWAMTGWRIGWAIAPREIARAMTALQSHTTSNAATVSQHAAFAALTQRQRADETVARMCREFRRRRDAARTIVFEAGIPHLSPEGAFYLYMDVSAIRDAAGESGTTFARTLLEEQGVAVVPGAAFQTPSWIRMSYAAPFDQVVEGARRIADAWRGAT